jgi:ubiquinol-cytochrome c reductase subunit 9
MQPQSFSNRLGKLFYNTLVRRNSVFLVGIFATAFAADIAYDNLMDNVWDRLNKGRQWKDIKDRY